MKRVLYASVIAMGCTIAVAAQGGAAKEKEKPMKDAAKSVTVAGCVAESGGHFMLNNATMPDAAGAPMSYALSGGALKAHVGHKVEVTGTMKPAAKDSMKDMSKDKMAKGDMKKEDMATAGTITVKDVKMVAASCS